jgi:hypothetical protein
MSRSLWETFLALFARTDGNANGNGDGEATADGGSTFVPSPLDLSVRVGHGGSDDEVSRELSRLTDRAGELDARRDDR